MFFPHYGYRPLAQADKLLDGVQYSFYDIR